MSMPAQYISPDDCTLCDEDLQHCHGTAIMIDEDSHVCSDDPACTLRADEHWFVSMDDVED
jgi:hypothetical protein